MKKWLITIIVLIVVVGSGIYGYSYFSEKNEAQAAPKVQTLTAAAEMGNVEVDVSGTGNITVINEELITAEGNATVEEVLVAVGDTVEAGAELITFEDDKLDPITAPFAGEITTLNVEAEQTVQVNTELVQVTDYTNLEMVVNVDELDIAKVQVGQTATINVNALEDKEFTGTVTSVAKEANEDSSSTVAKYAVNITINEPAGIKVGMTAEATITTEKKENVVTVPVAAIQKQGDSYHVLVPAQDQTTVAPAAQEEGEETTDTIKTTQKPVEIGLQNDTVVEIISGLAAGDEVVLPSLNTENSSQTGRNGVFQNGGFPGGNMGERPAGMQGDRGGNMGESSSGDQGGAGQ